jgi:hypothetical protein
MNSNPGAMFDFALFEPVRYFAKLYLDRAGKVPNLFIDVSHADLPEAATKPGTA